MTNDIQESQQYFEILIVTETTLSTEHRNTEQGARNLLERRANRRRFIVGTVARVTKTQERETRETIYQVGDKSRLMKD